MLAAGEARDRLVPPRAGMTNVHQNVELIVLDKKNIYCCYCGECAHTCCCGDVEVGGCWESVFSSTVGWYQLRVPSSTAGSSPMEPSPWPAWLFLVLLCFLMWVWDPAQGLSLWQQALYQRSHLSNLLLCSLRQDHMWPRPGLNLICSRGQLSSDPSASICQVLGWQVYITLFMWFWDGSQASCMLDKYSTQSAPAPTLSYLLNELLGVWGVIPEPCHFPCTLTLL